MIRLDSKYTNFDSYNNGTEENTNFWENLTLNQYVDVPDLVNTTYTKDYLEYMHIYIIIILNTLKIYQVLKFQWLFLIKEMHGIGRGTFYNYFTDVNDIFDWYENHGNHLEL